MAPELRPRPIAVGPQLPPETVPQVTPEGNVEDLALSTQAQNGHPNYILVPPARQEVVVPTDAIQQLVQLLQRQEVVNQARTFRFTELEAEVADLRGRQIADQGSPDPESPERRNPARRRQPRSPPRNREAPISPRHHSVWASSSPTRHRSRSHEDLNHHGNQDPYRRHQSPPQTSSGKRRSPFTINISGYRVPRYLEKPPQKMPSYDGTGDQDRFIG